MLRIRPAVAPLLRRPVFATSSSLSRPLLYQCNSKFRSHGHSLSGPFNRQFSLFGLFHKPVDISSPKNDSGNPAAAQSTQSSESIENPAPESVDQATVPSAAIDLETLPSPSIEPDAEIVISLAEQILTPPITLLSRVFVIIHDVIPYNSWTFTILFVTVSFRLTSRMFLEGLGTRRSKQLRSAFEPMRNALTGYLHNPQFSCAPRAKPQTVQRLALTLRDRISNHYTPQGVNYAPLWARLSQIPLFLGISEALRAMLGCNPGLLGLIFGAWTPIDPKLHSSTTLASLYRPDMAMDNSILDFGNLTIPDPTDALPLTFAAIVGWNLYQGLKAIRNRGNVGGGMLIMAPVNLAFATGATFAAYTIAKSIPAGLLLFWIANGLMSINLRLLKWLGVNNIGKDLPPGLRVNSIQNENVNGVIPLTAKERRQREFVAPTRKLTLSKRQAMFLADDIMPKKRAGR